MTIVHRLAVTLAAALFGMLLIGFIGLMNLGQAQKRFDFVGSNTLPAFAVLSEVEANLLRARTGIYQHALNTDPARKAAEEKNILESLAEVDHLLENYATNHGVDEAGKTLVKDSRTALQTYRKAIVETMAISVANDQVRVQQQLTGAVIRDGRALSASLAVLLRHNHKQADAVIGSNAAAYRGALAYGIGVMLLALALSAVLAFMLFRVIRQGLASMEGAMRKVADELDFTTRAPVLRMDEIGKTATAFNGLLDCLQTGFRSLTGDAQGVAAAAQQLNAVAANVAHAATAQSDSSSSMAATIEQVTVSVNHVAERAAEAQQLSESSVALAQSGSAIVAQTVGDIRGISKLVREAAETIRRLETQSTQVSNVVQVIREVADQTNLLALNAAIEAARAGEQGRGFAVVADEVRKLAERTTASTQEIAGTIASMRQQSEQAAEHMHSVEQLVGQSEQRTDDVDQAIARIGQSAADTAGTVSEISGAIREQGAASNEIAVKVEAIARMAEEASVAASQAAQAAAQLAQQAAHQIATLQQYRL